MWRTRDGRSMAELGLVEWDGAPRPAVLFRWSKRSGTIAIFSVITVGLLGVVGLATSRGLGDRLLASLLLLISLAGLIGSLGILWGTRFIALLPQGILKRDLPGSTFVAWDTIEAVGRYQLSWQSCLGLRTREPPRVEGRLALVMNRLGRVIRGMDGGFLRSWGEGLFSLRTHGITIGPDDSVYCVDDGGHSVRKFTPDGGLLLTIGPSGMPSDSGYDGKTLATIARGAPPFNRPTNLALTKNGDLYVSDGYGNSRVHRFTAAGDLVLSWGEPGSGPGEFRLPHGIGIHDDGRVFVCDRENDRIQIFDPDGVYLGEIVDVQRPTQLVFRHGLMYVAELGWRAGQRSFRNGPIARDLPSRSRLLDESGRVTARFGGADPCAPGSFCAAHGIAVDEEGDLYVAEVTWTIGGSAGLVPPDCHTFQKLALSR